MGKIHATKMLGSKNCNNVTKPKDEGRRAVVNLKGSDALRRLSPKHTT